MGLKYILLKYIAFFYRNTYIVLQTKTNVEGSRFGFDKGCHDTSRGIIAEGGDTIEDTIAVEGDTIRKFISPGSILLNHHCLLVIF